MTDGFSASDNVLVLIVDDEETQRLLTRHTLAQHGFRVEDASNGEDGLKMARELRPDLVLLDVIMPGIDGFEVCRQIRAEPTISNTPIIIVTGQGDAEHVQAGFSAGATDFLTKPVEWNLLPDRIRFVLRTHALERELRDAREVAEAANEAKSALLATMGHELRTPLNAIIGFSDLIKREAFGSIKPSQYKEYIGNIHFSGMQLLNAINDILEIVNCESGKLELRQTDSSIVDLVESVIRKIGGEAEELSIRIVNDVKAPPENSFCFRGDEQRLHQALFNVVSNAVKFNEAGGSVHVNMSFLEHGGLVLAVEDDGIGISAEDLPRIMLPFEQADSNLSRNFEGLGLGIPLAVAIVRLFGGDIEYESELGKGTIARITLPGERVIAFDQRASTLHDA